MIQHIQASNYLCLDILLAFIDHMAKRMDVGALLWFLIFCALNCSI